MTSVGTTAASKSELAYDLIHTRILAGHYEPGTRLVLGTLGAEIGTSVVPVREAIRRLEAEGMVTFEKNIGARVAEIDDTEYLETMQTMSIVEGAAVALAAPVISPEALTEARTLNERMRDLIADFDPVAFTSLNEAFHRLLSDPCPNTSLRMLVDRGWARLGRLRRSTFSYVPERALASVEEHAALLRLIETGAPAHDIELAVRSHRLATPHAYLHHHRPHAADPKELAP
ncbi:MAG: GntR family transcriptional regulator [Brachybacterium sp.]|nr:GntR family transcriptional regulator [Brachybacterium sp.]